MRESGVEINELRAVGGGARSDMWLRLKADICEIPLCVPRVTQAACLGAAILASVADGAGRKLESVVQEAVKIGRRIEPCRQSSNAYRGGRELYRELYPGLISLLRQCRVIQAETQNDS